MKNYPKYKKSNLDWLEEIPKHWKDIDVRKAFIKNEVKNKELQEDNLLTLSYGSIKRKNIKTANGLLPASFDNYQILQKGMIVLRMLDLQNDKNSLRVGYVKEQGIITSAYIGLDSKIDCNTKYFYYLLHFMDLIKHFYNGGGGVRQSIGFTDFRRELIILPPKQEQTAIANFLDYKLEKIDRFISKKKQLVTLLNEQKIAIINQAVTKGLNPNAKMKAIVNNWLNELPCAFEIESFSKNVFLKHGFQFREEHFSNEGIRIVKISQLSPKGILELSKASFVPLNYKDKFENIVIEKGDILMALTGGTIGKIIKANPKNEILLQNYRVGNFYPKNSKIIKNYLYWILKSDFVQAQMSFYVRETGQPNIGKGDFNKIQLIIPSIKEQAQIVNYIETETIKIEKTISTIEKEITLVEEYKTALIAEAVTGKIDVRDFEIPNQETPLAMVAEEVEIYKKS